MFETYHLSQDEYLFLHVAFRSTFAWGVQYEFTDESARDAAMKAASLTLQQKKYLSFQDDHMYVRPELLSLMEVCAKPKQVLLFVHTNYYDDQDLRFVYWGDDMLVEDRVLSSDTRQLQRISTPLALAQRLKTQLELAQQPQANGTAQTLPSAVLEQIRLTASQGKDAVLNKLVQAGMDETSAASLAQAYIAPVSNAVLTRLVPDVGEDGVWMATNMVLIESAEGMWEIHMLDATQVAVTPVDAEAAWRMLAGFCGAAPVASSSDQDTHSHGTSSRNGTAVSRDE